VTIEDGDKSIAGGSMTINRALVFSLLMSAIGAGGSGPAVAQACTREGANVSCDDGRRGLLSGDAIIWPDGSRSSLTSPHPGVIIGNKSSVIVGQGVFVGQGKGVSRWTIRARRTRRDALSWMALRIAIRTIWDWNRHSGMRHLGADPESRDSGFARLTRAPE